VVNVAINNSELSFDRPIVEINDTLTLQSRNYLLELENKLDELSILEGSGSPEGVVEALPKKRYMDTSGVASVILYIKRDADIAGDKSQGWVLV